MKIGSRIHKDLAPYYYLMSGDRSLLASQDKDYVFKKLAEYEKQGWTVRVEDREGNVLS